MKSCLNRIKTKSKQSVENQSTTEVTKKLGSLIVSGNHDVRLPFDKLTERYCSFFLQGKCNKTHAECKCKHSPFPKGMPKADCIVLDDWVKATPYLSWTAAAEKAFKEKKASS